MSPDAPVRSGARRRKAIRRSLGEFPTVRKRSSAWPKTPSMMRSDARAPTCGRGAAGFAEAAPSVNLPPPRPPGLDPGVSWSPYLALCAYGVHTSRKPVACLPLLPRFAEKEARDGSKLEEKSTCVNSAALCAAEDNAARRSSPAERGRGTARQRGGVRRGPRLAGRILA